MVPIGACLAGLVVEVRLVAGFFVPIAIIVKVVTFAVVALIKAVIIVIIVFTGIDIIPP